MKKIALTAVLALAVSVVPAAAKEHPGRGDKAKTKAEHVKPESKAKSRKCKVHGAAYVVGGTLESGTLTPNADGTYDGTLTIAVSQANHHAKADKATSKTYTLDDARVNLHGTDPAAALTPGSRVKLQGKLTRLAKKCDQTGSAATTTIRKASIKDPKAPEAPEAQPATA